MVHWGWLVLAFLAGIVCGIATCICVACCTIAGIADEEEQEMMEELA